jgi:hypothetical protein
MWEIKIKHEGLHAYRTVRGATEQEAETKARLQIDAWNARWARFVERETARQERLKKRNWVEKQSDRDFARYVDIETIHPGTVSSG